MRISLDANILYYAADEDGDHRRGRAQEVVGRAAASDAVLALQSLAEFYNASTRRNLARAPMTAARIREWQKAFPLVGASEAALEAAVSAHQQHGIPFWDAMLWATVEQAGCSILITEDFQDGRALGGVTFVDPFKPANAARLDAVLAPLPDLED